MGVQNRLMHDHQLIYITKQGLKQTLYTLGNLYLFNFSYSHLLLIRWGASQVLFIYFATSQFDRSIIQKIKNQKSNYEGSILKYWIPPLWPTYIGDRRTRFAKANGIKSEVLWITCWGTYGNPLGTHREHSGNTMGTKEKWGGKKNPSLTPNLKGKKRSSIFIWGLFVRWYILALVFLRGFFFLKIIFVAWWNIGVFIILLLFAF